MRTIALVYLFSRDAAFSFHPIQVKVARNSQSLHARRHELSELNKLSLKRLALRRPEPEPMLPIEEEDEYDYNMPMEYLYDDTENEVRYDDDAFFHVLLLPSTFNDRRTRTEHVATTCAELLDIPYSKAYELSMFAKYESFSILGTWTRKECIAIGGKLREMDIECRLVPHEQEFAEWICHDMVPQFELEHAGPEYEAELSTFMAMTRSHDENLEAYMKDSNDQQKADDSLSLSS